MTNASAGMIWGLGVTQIIGYGTLYYSFSVLAPAMAADFGWTPEWSYGALSIALIAGGLLAPFAGRLADTHGAGRLLAAGSVLAALALALTSLAPNGVAFLAGLIAVELASAFVLYSTAFAAIVQAGGQGAQRSIVHLTLIAGFASTLFWPLTAALHQQLDWREIYLVFAGLHLVLCLPIHLWVAKVAQPLRQIQSATYPVPAARGLAKSPASTVFALMLCGFLLEGFVLSAVLVHMVPLLDGFGLAAAGVLVTTMFGPAQVLSRLVNMVFGGRLRQTTLAIIAAALLPAGLAILLVSVPSVPGALLFALLFGLGSGLTSIVGGTLPLELFGQSGYGARLGWVSSARLMSSALAPFALALMLGGMGRAAALWIVAGLGILGAMMFLLLSLRASRLQAMRQVALAGHC